MPARIKVNIYLLYYEPVVVTHDGAMYTNTVHFSVCQNKNDRVNYDLTYFRLDY